MTSHQTPVDELLRHYKTDPARGLTAEQHIGDPTETSIIVAAHKNGLEQGAMTQQYPRLAELPFDSDRKPKPKDESLFAHGLGLRIVLQGAMFALLSMAAFAIGEAYSSSISIKTVIVKIGGRNRVHQKWFRQALRRRFFVILLLVLLSKQETGEAAQASPFSVLWMRFIRLPARRGCGCGRCCAPRRPSRAAAVW